MTPTPTHDRRRVSARELYETTWRALLAAGISAGEAASAARSVRHAEINFGAGLLAVPAELARATASREPCQLVRGAIDVVHDPSNRGILVLAPLAIGLVATPPSPSPVLIPGREWDPVLPGVVATQSVATRSSLVAVEVDGRGQPGAGAVAEPDGAVGLVEGTSLDGDVLGGWVGEKPIAPALAEAGAVGGLLFSSAFTALGVPDIAPMSDPATTVIPSPIEVDAAEWQAVYTAAQRFLVAEG